MNYFIENVLPEDWDGLIHMCSVKGKLDWRELEETLPCGDGFIQVGYRWNGASVGPARKMLIIGFPKWKHPMATCRHDIRCEAAAKYKKDNYATYKKLRKIADQMFKKDVGVGGTWWEQQKGYVGVRIGAFI